MMLPLLVVCLLSTEAEPELTRFSFRERQMGVAWELILYAADEAAAEEGAKAAFGRVEELNRTLSDYDPESELSKLSLTAGQEGGVPVSDDLWAVLRASQDLAEWSGGAFDVTVGPIVKLWRRTRRNGKLPPAEELTAARSVVGYKLLELDADRQSARLLKPGMRLDLGGIAMGYAVDEALHVLRRRGITRALLDASGDIGLGDPPPGAKGWRIGVGPLAAPPDGTRLRASPTEGSAGEEGAMRYLLLANCAVTTSGDAFQHVDIGGRRYSHIVDPQTGLGLTDRSSVTVIARDCIAADSLATTVSVLGPEAGLKLLEEIPGTAALILRRPEVDVEVVSSPGWGEFEEQEVAAE